MKKLILTFIFFIGSICTNAQQLLEVLKSHGGAQLWDRTYYIGSFNHSGANVDGEIINPDLIKDLNFYEIMTLKKHLIGFNIPYNEATIGYTYPEIKISRTVKDRYGVDKVLTLTIPAGTFTTSKGYLNGEINIDDDEGVYKVKYIDANEEEVITSFTFNIGNGRASTITLIASGGILDKYFNIETNGELEHQFIYIPKNKMEYPDPNGRNIPDYGAPYNKKWLNMALGSSSARVGYDIHDFPLNTLNLPDDDRVTNSLYRYGRDSDGHELVKSTPNGYEFKHPDLNIYDNQLQMPSVVHNPCPSGYRIPLYGEAFDIRIASEKYAGNLWGTSIRPFDINLISYIRSAKILIGLMNGLDENNVIATNAVYNGRYYYFGYMMNAPLIAFPDCYDIYGWPQYQLNTGHGCGYLNGQHSPALNRGRAVVCIADE